MLDHKPPQLSITVTMGVTVIYYCIPQVFHMDELIHSSQCFDETKAILTSTLENQESPGGAVIKNSPANAGDARDFGFDPWVEKTPWRRAWQPTPVFLPGEIRG